MPTTVNNRGKQLTLSIVRLFYPRLKLQLSSCSDLFLLKNRPELTFIVKRLVIVLS